MLKKTLALLLALIMVFSLAACTTEKPQNTPENPADNHTEDPAENPTEDPAENPTEEPTEDPAEDPSEEPTEDPSDAAVTELEYVGVPGSGIPGTKENLADNLYFGCDLSFYNVNDTDYRDYITSDDSGADYSLVDFEKMKADGCDFVIIRLGSEDASGRFFDPHFITYYNMAREAGLDIGLYFYSYSLTYENAVADAQFVIDVIEENDMYFEYPIFIDLEEESQLALPEAEISNVCVGWCETLKDAGYFPAIYSSFFMYDNISASIKSNVDFWIAYVSQSGATGRSDYNPDNTNISNEACMWQYDWHAGDEFDGIGLDFLDVNVSYKDYPSIMAEYGYNNVNK